jgi:hypothetical protein
MNQHNQYAPGKYYDINSGNITTIDDTIILKHEVIFEELEEITQPDVLGVDAFGRAYRQPVGGGGDVNGPASSTDNAVARFDQVTGKLIQNSGVILDDNDELSLIKKLNINMVPNLDLGILKLRNFASPASNWGTRAHWYLVDKPSIGNENPYLTMNVSRPTDMGLTMGIFWNGSNWQASDNADSFHLKKQDDKVFFLVNQGNNTANFGVNEKQACFIQTNTDIGLNIDYVNSQLKLLNIVDDPTNDKILTIDVTGKIQSRDLSTNPYNPFDQSLNSNDVVVFNTVNCGSSKVLQLQVNEIDSFVGPGIEIKSTNLRIESTNFTVLPSTNVNFDSALTIDLTNSAVDFTNSTVTGLPAGGDVSGPASSVDNGIATYNGTTGKVIQTSNMQIIGTTLNLNGDLDGGIATFNSVNTAALASKTLLPILLNSDISAGTLTLEPSGVLTNTGNNVFENSTTNFINANVDFTGASILGLPSSGDVSGPVSSTDNAICRFDGATGKIIQNSGITISDTNNLLTSGNVDCFDLTVDNLLNAEDLVAQSINSQTNNDFSNSATLFTNAVNVDFTNANVVGLDRVQFVGTSPVLGQIPFYDDNTGNKINNSGILINGVNDLTNVNGISCTGINTGQGIVECYPMNQDVLTTSDVSFNSISGNKIETQEIVKVGSTTTGTNPNRITLETGLQIPFQLWSRGGSDESFMGFDISNASTNFLSNSNSQVLFEKTGVGLSIYGGNQLAGNSFQITSLNKLVTFGDANTRFDDAVIFDDSITSNSPFVTMNNVLADNTNTSFLTLDGSNQLRTTSLVNTVATLSGSVYFTASGGILTTFPAVDVFVFPITNFTTNLTVQQNCIGDTSGGIIIDAGVPSGICKIMSTCSVKGSNTSNNIYDVSIKRNNVLIDCTVQKISTTDTTLYISTTIQCLSPYDAGDVFQTFFRNKVDTDSLDIESCTFTLHKI